MTGPPEDSPGARRGCSLAGGLRLACSYWILLLAWPGVASAQDASTLTLFGTPGLVDMPSARMAPDGQLSLGASYFKNTQHYNLNFQALPWLETSFRYTGLQHFDPAYSVYYDRSFAVKVRLFQEGDILPAVAIGVNDLIGTGVYGGEYLVASKRFGALDATIGMGWGRLASNSTFKNPLTLLSSSFEARESYPNITPGATPFNAFFHGPSVGLFGGLTWETPIDGLSLAAEYSSDKYSVEQTRGTFTPHSQINFGASYQLTNSLNAGVDWLYGESIGAHISFSIDPTTDPYPRRLGPSAPEPRIRTMEERQAAIAGLSGRHDASRSASNSVGGELVDALWHAEPDLADVGMHGQQLTLVLSRGDTRAACAAIAKLVDLHSSQITRISVSMGRQNSNCVPSRGAPAVWYTEPENIMNIAAAAAPTPVPVMTINAAGPPALDSRLVEAQLRSAIASQQIAVEAIELTGSRVTIYYGNTRYFSESAVIDRLTQTLMAVAPPQIEEFRFVSTEGGMPTREFNVLRAPAEREYQQAQTASVSVLDEMDAHGAEMSNPALSKAALVTYPRFSWSIFPQFRQELFDPNNPVGVQFLAGASATLEIFPGFSVTGEAEASIYDDFAVGRAPNSLLPHVRTDFLSYFTKGKNGIGQLEADYQFRLSPNVFAIVRAGYLESMFAGAGGQVLWRPEGQRWALGIDLYEVQQRQFDRLFGLQPYRVTTGHISLYYASPWYGLNFTVRAGRYLAGDEGVTFEASRRFSSGVEIGAYFTKTNVSAQQFGEGSFDKGIIIRIPLGIAIPLNTQNEFMLDLKPVQRDGGQRLLGDDALFGATRRSSIQEMQR